MGKQGEGDIVSPSPHTIVRGEGGWRGGSGTQTFVYQKWPNKISPIVDFAFSLSSHFGLQGGRGVQGGGGGGPPLLLWRTAILIHPWFQLRVVASAADPPPPRDSALHPLAEILDQVGERGRKRSGVNPRFMLQSRLPSTTFIAISVLEVPFRRV